jgi:UDP-glucose 4-epimerase
MNVAVVGGSGFVGRHVVRWFLPRGARVVNIDERAPASLHPGERFVAGEIGGGLVPERAAERSGSVDAVVWLAAVPNRRRIAVDETAIEDLNDMVEAPVRYLEGLAERPSSVVYVSSIQVYGPPRKLPVDEEHPTEPEVGYGIAKLCGESYVAISCRARDVPLAVLRPSFIYGPGQHSQNVIPRFLAALREGKAPVVHGTGREIRDDVYVGDVAHAIGLAVERRARGVFNVASGSPHTLLEVANAACLVSGLSLRPVVESKASDWTDRWFAVDKALRELSLGPGTPLSEGLRAMWREGAP